MHLTLRQRFLLILTLPVVVTAVVMFQDLMRVRRIHDQLRVIEISDEIHNTLFELKRYERNALLFADSNETRQFAQCLNRLKKEIHLLDKSSAGYQARVDQALLHDNLARYDQAASALVALAGTKKEELVLESTQPLKLRMHHHAREIEKLAIGQAELERTGIHETVGALERSFSLSYLFLLCTMGIFGYLLSRKVITPLKRIETSMARLADGEYAGIFDIDAPPEILSLVEVYNRTVRKLRESRKELEATNRELVENQDRLVEARQTAAMRLLASEIAHEVNNPLSSLNIFLGLFHEEIEDNAQQKELVSFMLKEVERCREIVGKLTAYARKEPLHLQEIALVDLVDEVIEVVLRQNAGKAICLTSCLEELPQRAVVDRTLIHQALFNVLSNAFQATPSGGSIGIRGYGEKDCALITVEDKGAGISEEHLHRIFEPFFSTRQEAGGTGLGLAITRKIIEKHRGRITVTSGEGHTVVTLTLPLHPGESGGND